MHDFEEKTALELRHYIFRILEITMNDTIFRKYDIRGIVDEDLTDELVRNIGRAFGTLMKREGLLNQVVGYDCRLSATRFRNALVEGITSAGCNVIDVGMVPTPLQYYAIYHLKADGGIMITGSHNPPNYNGLKMCRRQMPIFDQEIIGLRDMIKANDYETGQGEVTKVDVIDDYINELKGIIKLDRPLKVIVDAGNGVAGLVAPRLYRELGCEVKELFTEPDGTFPNHHPDPTHTDNLQELIAEIKKGDYDFGLGFDGDGDRVGVIDPSGEMLYGDELMVLLSRELLSRKPGSPIIFDVKCSQNLVDDIKKHGGEPVMWKTGHSFIKVKMKELDCPLAGEMSGHIFFEDRFFGYDDATYAGARLMEIAARSDKSFKEMLSDLPPVFNTPEIKFPIAEEKKFAAVDRIAEHFRSQYDTIDIDGIRVNFDDGWALARASNTTPYIVLRFEAQSEERLNEIQTLVMGVVEKLSK
jgi:phosphomannomutase/phosphoglucomutase